MLTGNADTFLTNPDFLAEIDIEEETRANNDFEYVGIIPLQIDIDYLMPVLIPTLAVDYPQAVEDLRLRKNRDKSDCVVFSVDFSDFYAAGLENPLIVDFVVEESVYYLLGIEGEPVDLLLLPYQRTDVVA